MIFDVKLLFSLSALLLGVVLLQRTQPWRVPPVAMVAGVLAAWGGVAVLGVGVLGFGLPLRPAVWVLGLGDGEAGARSLLITHAALGGVALLGISVRVVLAALGHPWERLLEPPVVGLWLAVWVLAMFGWA